MFLLKSLHFPFEPHSLIPGTDRMSRWSRNIYYYHSSHNYCNGIGSSDGRHPRNLRLHWNPSRLTFPRSPYRICLLIQYPELSWKEHWSDCSSQSVFPESVYYMTSLTRRL